jgi:hypothetical protein
VTAAAIGSAVIAIAAATSTVTSAVVASVTAASASNIGVIRLRSQDSDQISTVIMIRNRIVKAVLVFYSEALI